MVIGEDHSVFRESKRPEDFAIFVGKEIKKAENDDFLCHTQVFPSSVCTCAAFLELYLWRNPGAGHKRWTRRSLKWIKLTDEMFYNSKVEAGDIEILVAANNETGYSQYHQNPWRDSAFVWLEAHSYCLTHVSCAVAQSANESTMKETVLQATLPKFPI
jgi:hypothetical protein